MQSYDLVTEFIDAPLEKGLMAAVAANTSLYWECADLLHPSAFAIHESTWVALAQAVEQEQSPPVPRDWKPIPNPIQAAHTLADLFQRRLLAGAQVRLAEALYDKEKPASEVAALLEKEAVDVQIAVRALRAGQACSMPSLFHELFQSLLERYEAVKEGKLVVGIPSGLGTLDQYLGGFQTGVHLLAAQPGMGKTTLTLQIAAHVASLGIPVLFVSFEESLERLTLKAVCQMAGLESKRYGEGRGNPNDIHQAMLRYGAALSPLYLIEGNGRLEVGQLKAKALAAMNKHKQERCLIVVDYVQRWAGAKQSFTDYRHVVAGMVSDLRELALRLKSPVLAISSQNRPGQGEARLTSLKESGDLEYSADTALFLVQAQSREGGAGMRAVDLVLAKNRFGDLGSVELVFQPAIGKMSELSFYEDVY